MQGRYKIDPANKVISVVFGVFTQLNGYTTVAYIVRAKTFSSPKFF